MENTKWEVTMLKIENEDGTKYKVTRRYPPLSVAETKIFSRQEDAKRQFEDWLGE